MRLALFSLTSLHSYSFRDTSTGIPQETLVLSR